MALRSEEEALGVAEIDLQRLRSQGRPTRPRVSYRHFEYPQLTSAPVELEPVRTPAPKPTPTPVPPLSPFQEPPFPILPRRRRPLGFAREVQFALRGALYDLMHYEALPAVTLGYRSKAHYVMTREGRAPKLLCCALAVLAALALLLAFL